MKINLPYGILLLSCLWVLFVRCEKSDASDFDLRTSDGSQPDTVVVDQTDIKYQLKIDSQAVVTAVVSSGDENNYTFQVTIASPDQGCNQYADWWEVFTPDSSLVYRRILTHSHVGEQPFTRSGGLVRVEASTIVYIRAHMNNLKYGSLVFSGSVQDGFFADTIPRDFAEVLESQDPLPISCAF